MQEKRRLKMQKSDMGRRAWNILRVALLWKRKGGNYLKNKILMDLSLVPKYFKNLGHGHTNDERGALYYGERELSFDDTPIFHMKMLRPSSLRFKMPNIPCIKPTSVDFDYDFEFHDDDPEIYCNDVSKMSTTPKEDEDEQVKMDLCEEDEIDLKAEKFIAKFHEQMRLQRQISYLQYNEMINRAAN